MTEKQLRDLVATWQHRLGLDLWEIEVQLEDADEDRFAICHRSTSYDRAVIYFQKWMLTDDVPPRPEMLQRAITDEVREVVVVHELLHCALRELRSAATENMEGLLHRDVFTIFHGGVYRAEEAVVERLAMALVRTWGTEPSGRLKR